MANRRVVNFDFNLPVGVYDKPKVKEEDKRTGGEELTDIGKLILKGNKIFLLFARG